MKGYRTIIFNALSAVVPIVSLTEWHAIFPAEWLPYWLFAVALINVYLRTVTSTALGRRE
jgi:hypothetical protein